MANSYSPPPTIEFFNSNFSNSLIYYNYQLPGSSIISSTTVFANMTCFTANSINIPVPGDYIIHVQTGAYSVSGQNRSHYKFVITKSAQTTINITDNNMIVWMSGSSVSMMGQFSRKVTFPVSGVWTLTPQWAADSGGIVHIDSGSDYSPWIVTVHSVNPLAVIDQQLTQFLNSSYTLMTNVDASAWWGSLTNTTVTGYGASISSLNDTVTSQTTNVNALTDKVDTLQNTVNGLTSLSTNSGGIKIKP